MGGSNSKDGPADPNRATPRSQWPARTAAFPDVTGSDAWRDKMRALFKRLDLNNDGRLGEDDLATMCKEFNTTFNLTGENAAQVLTCFREMHDRYFRNYPPLNQEEFVDRVLLHINGELRVDIEEQATAIAALLSDVREGKRSVERDAFEKYAKVLRMTHTQVDEIFMVLAKKNDCVSHEQLLDAVADFYFSEEPNSPYRILWTAT